MDRYSGGNTLDIIKRMRMVESGNRDYDANGNPIVSSAGAKYAMQVLAPTAFNPGYGVEPAKEDSPEEFNRVGEDYFGALLNEYGDRRLATAAYNGGPDRMDKALKQTGGDPLAAIRLMKPETQQYVTKVLGNGGDLDQLAALVNPDVQSDAIPDLPPGKAAETGSKDALQELISIQKQRMQGDPERDRRMMWLNFFQGLGGNHASIGDALVSGTGAAAKTVAEQHAQHEKMVDSSLDNQIRLTQMQQEQGLREAQANYYNAGARGVRGAGGGQWVSTKDAAGNPILFNKATSEVKPLGDDAEKAPPKLSYRDEIRMAKSDEGAQAATKVERLADEGLDILKNYKTGMLAPAEGWWDKAMVAVGMAGAPTEKEAKDFETVGKIGKQLGTVALQQFGGNDTDKELQIAIESTLDPKALPATNIELLKRQKAGAQILQQKPDFEAQWVAKTGGLNRLDPETGQSFGKAWLKFQRDAWNEAVNPGDAGSATPTPEGTGGESAAPPPESKTLNGKTYTKVNGKWHEQ